MFSTRLQQHYATVNVTTYKVWGSAPLVYTLLHKSGGKENMTAQS
jgi:hypothetical protein